ncbi:MAG: hypothetical protein LBG48_05930 [Rickettsiales bacterium]|jgi:hypothetical protein|nr:hypothetical protein [Rickettsiales bacterium]
MKTKKIISNKHCQMMMSMFFVFAFMSITAYGQDAANEIKSLWNDQIQPIINVLLMIAVGIAALWLLFQFFSGKKEALKQLGYVIGGAVVFRVLSGIVGGIVDRQLSELITTPISDVFLMA